MTIFIKLADEWERARVAQHRWSSSAKGRSGGRWDEHIALQQQPRPAKKGKTNGAFY
jgi:hypothetical protein